MNRPAPTLLQPRKIPQQARSSATVEAIHDATVQVLLAEGAGRLSTTRVAERAGVSVGTLYQYYPHKQALLFAIVERHLEGLMTRMEARAGQLKGRDLTTVAEGLAIEWLEAKLAEDAISRAIYAIAAEFDLRDLIGRAKTRMMAGIGVLLESVPGARFGDIRAVSFMLMALLAGAVRVAMEAGASEEDRARLRRELPRACSAYLAAAC